MVKDKARILVILAAATLALSIILLSAVTAGAQDENYDVVEEYRIVLNDVGDTSVTDTLVYDSSWFTEYGYIFEENPNLLSRRYRADSTVGEFEEFNVDVDSSASTITVTFNTPGQAYNFEDEWALFGFIDYQLVSIDEDEAVLEAYWTWTSEYTLFEDMSLGETLIVEFPEGVEEARFDEGKGAIYYVLPYAGEGAGGGFLERNRTTFSVIFSVVMALSLLLFIIVVTRRPSVPLQPAASTAAPLAATAVPGFCKRCGQPAVKPGERFCQNCGAPLE